ncbi:MAG: hypothetical protein LC808_28725 [Actinobacteria bacterium]|nr:hypothetical protein [Actinomycetota bacterium]
MYEVRTGRQILSEAMTPKSLLEAFILKDDLGSLPFLYVKHAFQVADRRSLEEKSFGACRRLLRPVLGVLCGAHRADDQD